MAKTFLEIAQNIATNARLNIPAQVFGSVDEDAVLIRTCIKNAALRDMMRADNWESLVKRHTEAYDQDLQSGALDYMVFDLPPYFDRIVNDTIWELNDDKPMVGPLTVSKRQGVLSGLTISAAVTKSFWVQRYTEGTNETKKVFAIYPTTTTGGSDDYSYQYISSQYVHDSLNNMKAEFTADSDLTVLDDDAVELAGLIRVLRTLGMDYGDEVDEFNAIRKERIGRDGGAPRVMMDDSDRLGLTFNLPETGYGS